MNLLEKLKHFDFRSLGVKGIALAASIFLTSSVYSNPSLNNVGAGSVHFDRSQPNTLTIHQNSPRAILNWNQFNIQNGETTHFQQPAGGVALNRISPTTGASTIYGRLTATGQIILINPAGFYFGPNSVVNVGGLIATTANISDQNFMNGIYKFQAVPGFENSSIINEGQIIAAQNGLIALVAPSVINNGVIRANLGTVVLASGSSFTMNFSGDNLISFAVDEGTLSSGGVSNRGTISANGGSILVTAKAASHVLDNVINMQGIVEAKSVRQVNGDLILGDVKIAGDERVGKVTIASNINVSGRGTGKGGRVTVTGNQVALEDSANIDVSGDTGGGDVYIGGNYQGKGPLPNSTTTTMAPGATITADALVNGNGGNVILWADDTTKAYGSITARGGELGGNGGFIETSGHRLLDINGIRINTLAPKGTTGTWLLDPASISIDTVGDTNISFVGGNTYQPSSPTDTASILNVNTLVNALSSTNITVTNANTSGNNPGFPGTISVDTPISWTSPYSLTLNALDDITVSNPITAQLGSLTLIAGSTITINAAITLYNGILTLNAAAATAGNSYTTITPTAAINVKGFNLVQGGWLQTAASSYPFFAANFQTNSGGGYNPNISFIRSSSGSGTTMSPYTIIDLYGLQGIGSGPNPISKSYILANNIDATSTRNWNANAGFMPIGEGTFFTGNFNGNGYVISNLYIYRPAQTAVGLFGFTNGNTISNLGVIDANITSGGDAGILAAYGGTSTLTNVFTTGTLTSVGGSPYSVGGLVGYTHGTISNSYSSASVTSSTPYAGGLIGYAGASPNVATISDSYATGSVVGTGGNAGGFAGVFDTGTITRAYSTGAVSGSGNVNGFVGQKLTGTISNSFYDTSTSGQASSGSASGVTGATTANLKLLATYSGSWGANITGTPSVTSALPAAAWLIINGQTRPILRSELNGFFTKINTAHQLQLMAFALDGDYTLARNIDASGTSNTADVWGGGSGFYPVGNSSTGAFTGTINGAGNIITSFNMPRASTTDVGLVGYSNGGLTIQNLGIYGTVGGSGSTNVGAFAGHVINATLTNLFFNGSLSGASSVGGIVGYFDSGTLTKNYAAGTITGSGTNIGGIVGVVESASNTVDLLNNYNIANVAGGSQVGGIAGGIFPTNLVNIETSYNTGLITGTTRGALIGFAQNPAAAFRNYFDSSTSGASSGVGATSGLNSTFTDEFVGLTTTASKSAASYNSWGITNTASTTSSRPNQTWFIFEGETRPILLSEWGSTTTTPFTVNTPHQVQLMAVARGASYTLGRDIDLSSASSNTRDVWNNSGIIPIGTSTSKFTGNFNGNYYNLQNMTISRSTSTTAGDNTGLFGYVSGSTIQNIGIVDATVSGHDAVGPLIGAGDNFYVFRAFAIGTTTGRHHTGGLIGFAAVENGTFNIGNSFSLGTVTSTGNNVGGLIGAADSFYPTTGVLTNSYSNANVSGLGSVGGLVGYANNISNIYQSYATGSVTGTNADVGGIIGYTNAGIVRDTYWDTDTSGTSYPGTYALYAGGNSATGNNTATMMTQSSYASTWDFTNDWGIIDGKSYPYLRAFYYQTPRAISGVSNLGSNANVTITANGSAITSNNLVRATTKTAANGGYYFLEPYNTISNSVPILVYTTGGSANAVTLAPASGGSLTGLTLTNNALNLGDANTNTITNANLSTAKGGLGSLALYSVSGNDLTVNSGINLNSTNTTTYSLAGNVTFTGGNGTVTFGGPVSLTGSTQFIIAGIGDIIFSNTLNGNSKLTLSNSGTTRFSGVVGGSTPLNSLSSVGGGTTNIRANISTSGTQTYNEDVTLGDDITTFLTYTLQSSAGAIDFLSTLNGPKYSLTGNAATSITLGAFVGGAGQFQDLSLTAPTMNVYGGVDLEGNMIFTGNTVLGDNSSFIGRSASSDITFTGTLNSASDASPFLLVMAAGDNIVLNGSLGNTGRLESIDASAGTAISLTGPTLVKSSGYQLYSGPIALSNDITFQSTGDNFNSTNGIAGVNSTTDLTIDVAGTTSSIDGVVSALSLVKAGTGTLALASGNTYSGTTTINGGTLQIGSDSALGTAPSSATPGHLVLNGGALETTANFTLDSNRGISLSAGGGTFRTNFATTLTYGGIIAGLGGLTKTGAGTLALTGTNSSYTGQTYIDNGILSVSKMSNGGVNSSIGATAAGSFILIGSGATGVLSYTGSGDSTDRLILITGSGGALVQSTNGLLTLNGDITTGGNPLFFDTNPGNITSNGVISGGGTLTKGGSGLLRLLGTNTYSGATSINAGTLQIAADSGLGTAPLSATPGHLTLNGGTLQTTATIALSNNRGISLGSSGGTLSPDLTTTLSYGGIIAGSGALTKANNGIVALSGSNTYTGATNINAGTLQIFADAGLGQAPVSATAGHLNFGGGFLTTTGTFTLNANRGINLTSTGFISNFSGDVLTYNGVIAGSGGLSKSGLGTWILGGTNTYSGATSIATGTIQIAADSALGTAPVSATPSQLTLNGGILRTTATFTLDSNRGINIAGGNGTVTTDPSTTLTYNGIMAGTGSLTKNGTGTLVLGGTNTYSGATNINAGNIQIAADSGLGTAPGSATPGQLSLASGTLITTASFALNANRGISLGAGGGSFSTNPSTTLTYNGIMAGSGALTKNGTGTLALGGANTYTGITTLNSGTLQIAADSGLGQAPVSATPAFLNISTGSTLQTTGTFTLSANRGISLGVGGAIFLTDPSTTLTYSGIMAGSGTLTKSGTGTLILGGSNSYTGATSINAGTLQIAADSGLGQGPVPATPGHLSLSGGILQTTATFALDSNRGISLGAGGGSISTDPSTTLTYNGIMAGSNAFTKLGAGTLILGGVNTYTGATSINAGNIQIAADSGLGQAPVSATPGQLSLASGTLITTASFVLNANRGISLGAGGGSFSTNPSTTLTYNGIMAGSGALTKNGTGTLVLGGANTYTGITTINSGTLQIAADSGLGQAPGAATPAFLNLSSGSTLQTTGTFTLDSNRGISLGAGGGIFLTDPSTTLTYNGIMAGSGTLTKSGTGTLILGGSNTYTGATSINAGNIQIAADSGLGTAPGSATPGQLSLASGTLITTASFVLNANRGISLGVGGGSFSTNPSTTLTYNGIMAGSGALTKNGTGTLVLGGANTYTGITTINSGTLQIAADSGLGQAPGAATPGHLSLSGGILQTTGTFTLDPNRGISLGAGGGSISTDPSTTLTYNGIMAGSNAFTKLGAGTLILSGINTYTGATNINAGNIQIAADSGLGTAPGSATPGQLSLASGTLITTASFALNANRGISLGAGGGSFSTNPSTTLTYNGIMAGSGALTKNGTGTLILGGVNTYSGLTNINSGTLQIAADSGLGTAPGIATPAFLNLSSGSTLQTTGSFTLNANRGITLGAGGGIFSTDPATTLTYNGIIASSGALTKVGTGTLILGGVNTYTGATNINAGTLQIAADSGLGTAPGSATAGQLSLNSGTLQTTATFTLNSNRGISLGAGGAISTDPSTTLTYDGVIAGTGPFVKTGVGTLVLGGVNTYSGATNIDGGTLQIAADSALGTAPGTPTSGSITLNNTVLHTTSSFVLNSNRGITLGVSPGTFNTDPSTTLTYGGVIDGSGQLIKSGSGTLALTGTNSSYTGTTEIDEGVLSVSKLANGGVNSSIGATPLATFLLIGSSTSGTLSYTGSGDSMNRTIAILGAGGGTIQSTSNLLTLSGDIQTSGNPVTFDTNTGNITSSGVISGAGSLTKTGSGTLTLSGINTYNGVTTVNGGTIQIAADSGLGQAPGAATPGKLVLNSGVLKNSATFTLNSNRGISLGAGGGTISTDPSTTLTYNGIMAGSGTLTKSGTGTLILGGSNSYTGATSINAGTLQIAGDSGLGTAPGAATPGHLNFDGGTLVTTNAFTINANRGINLGSSGGTLSPNVGLVLTYDGIVAGTGALTKAGTGVLSLGGVNTFGGGTNLNAGTIIATNNTALSTGSVTGATNSTLQINSGINVGNALSLQGTGVGGVGALVAGGSGATASGAISLAGATTISSGGSASNTLLLSNTVNGGFALTTQGSGSLAFGSTVGNSSPLASLASNSNLIISGGSIVTTGTQTYNNPVTLADITTLSTTNSAVAFNSTLDTDTTPRNLTINAGSGTIDLANVGTGVNGAIGDLALNSTSTTTLGGLIMNAASLTTNSGGTTNLNTATLTTTGSTGVVFNDAVNVGVNSQISAGTGPITFGSTLDSPLTRTLTLNTSGTTRFNGRVGDLNPFSSITTDAGGTTFINTSNLYASGSGMFFNDNVLINQPSVVLFTTGSISFGGTIDSNTGTNYELQAIGNSITVNGAIGATRPLDNFAIVGNSTINAPSITTSGVGGSQTYAGDVTLGNNVDFTADSSIDFFGTVNGAFNIGLNAAGTTTFGDNVGLTTAPTAINSTGVGDVNFFGAVGDATHRLGTISIAGNSQLSGDVYTSGDQSYGGLALNIDAILDTGASATSDITLAGITGNSFGLTLNSAGNTQLSGSITGLDNITTNAAGTTTIGASISTSARQTYNDNVTLGGATTLTSTGDDIIFAGNLAGGGNTFAMSNVGNLSSIAGTVSNLSGFTKQGSGTLALSGNNTYTGATTVSGGILSAQSNTALGSGAATVNSGATLQVNNNSIANNLTLSGTGTSGQGALVAANANSTVSGNITLAAATTVGSLSATDALLLNGSVSGSQALTLSGSGRTTLGNTVNVASVTSNTATTLQSSVTTSGNQSYNNAVTLGGTTTLNSSAGNGAINFASSINGANSLAINSGSGSVGFSTIGLSTAPTNLSSTGSGTVTFNAAVGDNTHRLTSVAITGPSNLNGGPIFTSGNQTYTGAITLGTSTTLDTGAGTGNTLSLNAVSGNQAFVLNNAGTTALNGTISGLASLNTDAPGQTNIGANVTTSGNQTYNDPVLLTNNATLTSTSGNILMAQNVNGGGNTLTINNAGVASFIVGILSNASIVKDGPGTLTLSSANTYSGSTTISGGKLAIVDPAGLGDVQGETIVTSGVTLDIGATGPINEPITLINGILSGTGAASLTGAVTLANNTTNTIQSNVGSTFDINGNINSENGGAGNLILQGAGTINVNGSIGNSSALASLLSNADLSVTGSVRTSGDQTYNNAITLASTANFTSLNGNIAFANALNGNSNLTISSGGTTSISDVGLATPLASLAINSGNGITMNGNNVVTAGNQSYTGVLTLTLPTEFVLNDDQAAITFNNGIIGGKNVAIGGFTGNHNFTINGALDVGNVTVDGFGSGNVFTLNNGNSQTWSLSGAKDGGIVTAGANSILFTGMDRVVGGSANDIFNLGSTAFAGTIGGGGGTNTLVATNASNTWTIDAVNGGTVTGLGGTFVNMQNLNGGTSDDSFTINGGKVSGTLDGGQGTNTLTGDNNNRSTWTITASNEGSVSTTNTNVGVNSFKNIQNLAGGASDNEFYLNGGSVSGNISGGSANDTIYANSSTPNTFNIAGTDAGSMTGVGGTFNNIENLTGGNQGNTFIFANNAKLNGYAMGGSLSQRNMLDYTAYSSPVQIFLSGNINDGNASGMNGMINRFGSINDIATNIASRNELTFPNTPNKVVITGTGAGYVNDPTSFSGFTVFHGGSGTNSITFLTGASLNPDGTVAINGVDHTFSGFDLSGLIVTPTMTMNIASIIQQPDTNHSDATQSDSTWLAMANSTVQNLNDIMDQAAKNYDTNLSKVKINPYCYAAQ